MGRSIRRAAAPRRRGGRFTEKRRTDVIQEAALLFIERGYEHVTIDDIVARIGGSKATIYAWFGGKAGLFETVIKEWCERTSRDLELEFDGDRPTDVQLLRFGKAFLSLILSRRSLDLHRLVISVGDKFPEVARTFFEFAPQVAYGIVARWIRKQQEAGIFISEDAEQLAVLYLDMLTGQHRLARLLSVGGISTPESIDRTVQAATQLLLRALKHK